MGCGLVQLSNDPVSYFREVIRAVGISPEMQKFRSKQFKEFINEHSLENKKIVEIGCGQGEYLKVIGESNVDAYGLEYSEKLVSQCKASGLKVFNGFIEDANYRISDCNYDAFYILNFLEHIPDINGILMGIRNNLNDGAVGIVEVPNFDMILKKNLFSEFTTDHLYYFTKNTLISTLSKNGFEILSCDEVWYDYIISARVKKRKRVELTHFYNFQEKLKDDLHKYIDSFEKNKVAIWGAGHQALAVICMTEIKDKIKYILDSAPFKQGKYSPATHIPIVAPEKLHTGSIDAVIVIAASYSDEVAKIIREKYSKEISVAILRDFGLEEV